MLLAFFFVALITLIENRLQFLFSLSLKRNKIVREVSTRFKIRIKHKYFPNAKEWGNCFEINFMQLNSCSSLFFHHINTIQNIANVVTKILRKKGETTKNELEGEKYLVM